MVEAEESRTTSATRRYCIGGYRVGSHQTLGLAYFQPAIATSLR